MSDLPLPVPGPDTVPFWDACKEHELRLQRCSACAAWRFPPQPGCAQCGSLKSEWVTVSGRGTVYTYAITHQPIHPALAGRIPFATVLVELEEGPLITSNLVDVAPEEITIGMPVEVTFEEVGDMTLPRFQRRQDPTDGPSALAGPRT